MTNRRFSLDRLAHEPSLVKDLSGDEIVAALALLSTLQAVVTSELMNRQATLTNTSASSAGEDDLLTVSDVARRLNLPSEKSVYRLVKVRALRPLRIGKRLRFRSEDLDEFVKAHAVPENVVRFAAPETTRASSQAKTRAATTADRENDSEGLQRRNRKKHATKAKHGTPARGRFSPAGLEV